jgi:hypothetical protein
LFFNQAHTNQLINKQTSRPPFALSHHPAGKIAEMGPHEELLSAGGIYTELMSSQGMIIGSSV